MCVIWAKAHKDVGPLRMSKTDFASGLIELIF